MIRQTLRLAVSTPLRAGALFAAFALFAAPLPAEAHGYKVGSIEIGHPWSRATPPGARTGAGYLDLTNTGAQADRLVSISSPAADAVEIHQMSIVDDVMTMRPVPEGLEIPAGGKAALAPGGYHLMLMGLKAPFRQGEMVPVTLTFEKAGTVEVELKVDAMGAKGPGEAGKDAAKGELHTH